MRKSSLSLLLSGLFAIAPLALPAARAQYVDGSGVWHGASGAQHGPSSSTSAPGPSHAASFRWVRFSDPAEGAFSIDVPEGWRVQGGTIRRSAIEIPMGVQAVSPDGAITVFYGDPNIPIYSVPSRMMAMGGYGPGRVFDMGNGVHTLIMPYMDGETFAAQWGARRVAVACGSPRLMGEKPRADSSRAIDYAYARGGVRTSVNAGEASFACNLRGVQGGGYVFAATELVQSQGAQIWDVKYVIGCIAPVGRAAEAYAVLARMASSFSLNRQWLASQQQAGAQFDRVVAETNAAVSQRIIDNGKAAAEASQRMIDSGRRNAQATYDANEKFDYFGVRGTSDFRDPNTGQTYASIDNSHAHVYVSNDSNHTVIATDSEHAPGSGWSELQQVQPGH